MTDLLFRATKPEAFMAYANALDNPMLDEEGNWKHNIRVTGPWTNQMIKRGEYDDDGNETVPPIVDTTHWYMNFRLLGDYGAADSRTGIDEPTTIFEASLAAKWVQDNGAISSRQSQYPGGPQVDCYTVEFGAAGTLEFAHPVTYQKRVFL